MAKMGRPAVEVPLDILDTACQFNANTNQILQVLESKGISITDDTLNAFVKRKFNMTFSEYRDKKLDLTRFRLVQKAVKLATEGNVTMLIFCLKNLCSWKDREIEEKTPKGDRKFVLAYEVKDDE